MQYTKCCVLFSMHEKNVRLQKHPHDFLRNAVIVGYCGCFCYGNNPKTPENAHFTEKQTMDFEWTKYVFWYGIY